jgi:WD40 repeat protein/tRNA A-37 threonylcarbamoyl transferase component Bud32
MVGTDIGPYTIRGVIGSGGMGVVYEAKQKSPRRTVALKMLKRGVASRNALRRFQYEAQTLARLRHEGIAQIFEAGTWDDGTTGRPWFAMEYLAGAKPITTYCLDKQLDTRERLELFCKVCLAVQHGHQKGIIHRDLKPSNILVTSGGVPKVIDFGVARSTDSDMAVTTLQTDIGALIGTLQYMSPEQCAADPNDIDTRSDVYALGVVLYELLCESLPYDIRNAAIHEAARIICQEQPTKPSTVNKHLRGDLEIIALKALEKDRDRRYQNASALDEDITRYLAGDPIAAKRPSGWDYLSRFARRNRAAAAAIVAVFGILVVAVVGVSIFAVDASSQRTIAETERDRANAQAVIAEEQSALAQQQRDLANEQRDIAQAAREGAEQMAMAANLARDEARQKAYAANIQAAAAAVQRTDAAGAHQRLAAARDLQASPMLQIAQWLTPAVDWRRASISLPSGGEAIPIIANLPFEYRYLAARSDDAVWALPDALGGGSVAFNADGTTLVTCNRAGVVRIVNLDTGDIGDTVQMLQQGFRSWYMDNSLSPDASKWAHANIDKNTISVGNVDTPDDWVTLKGHEGRIRHIAFNGDGSRLASSSTDDPIHMWDTATGEIIMRLAQGKSVAKLALSPDGTRLAVGNYNHTIHLWDTRSSESLASMNGHAGTITALAFSPDGERLASGSHDTSIRLWNARTGEALASMTGHSGDVTGVAFSPDGAKLASVGEDRAVRLWDCERGDSLGALFGHEGAITSIAYCPDGLHLATTGQDRTTRVWDTESLLVAAPLRGHRVMVTSVAYSPDGTLMASGSIDRTIGLWDVARGERIAVLHCFDQVLSIAFNPDGTRLAAGLNEGRIVLWDVGTGEQLLAMVGHDRKVSSIDFNHDGTRIVSGSEDGTVRLWDAHTGAELVTVHRADLGVPIESVAFSPDGKHLAAAILLDVLLWTSDGATLRGTLSGHRQPVASLAFSPASTLLASGSWDATIRVWSTATGEELRVLTGHNQPVDTVRFGPDGTRLVSSSWDGTARIWDTANGEELLTLPVVSGEWVRAVTFSPDGTRLATADRANGITLWQTRSRGQVARIRRQARKDAIRLAPVIADWIGGNPDDRNSDLMMKRLDRVIEIHPPEDAGPLRRLALESLQGREDDAN